MSDVTPPELSWSAQRRDGTWEKIGTGLSRGIMPEGSSFSHAFEGSIGGPAVGNFILSDKARRRRPDLEHFTPVVAHSGAVPVFSGRVIRTPEVRGEKYQRHVEVQGWKEHTKDDPLDRIWAVSDLSKWNNSRGLPEAVLTNFQGVDATVDGNAIVMPCPVNSTLVNGRCCGATFDAGPNNLITRAVATVSIGTTVGSAAYTIYLRINNSPNPLPTTLGDAAIGNPPVTDTVLSASAATGGRYVHVFWYWSGANTVTGADHSARCTSAIVFTDDSDEALNVSDLHASTVIGETLTAKCPKLSTDQSGILATTFDIPEFYSEWMYPNQIIDAVNAYHGYQVLFSADPTSVVRYRAVPTTPVYAVGVADEYEFDNPSTYDGSEVYNQVIGKYTDAAGVAGFVSCITPTAATYALSAAQLSNPSFTTDTTGWTLTNFARDAAIFESSPASLASTINPNCTAHTNAFTGSGLTVGKQYQVAFWARSRSSSGGDFNVTVTNSAGTIQVAYASLKTQLIDDTWVRLTVSFIPIDATPRIQFYFVSPSVVSYIDSVQILEASTSIVARRGFTRTKLVEFRSKMTAASATQVCQVILDASQDPPLKGTLKLRGHIRRYGSGAKIHVSQIRLGEPILLEDEVDPNTGAIGRIGIIMAFTYDHDSQTATITIDSNKNFVENLLNRLGAF